MTKQNLLYLLFLIILFALAWRFTAIKERPYQLWYDYRTNQQPIQKRADIDKVLQQLEPISYQDLSTEYLEYTESDLPTFKKMLENGTYYRVRGDQIFQFVVGDFRIKHFLPRDDYYYAHLRSLQKEDHLNWLINKELLYKLLELQDALFEKNLNETGFVIVNGFRHPNYNAEVGGASKSRHVKGEAVDISIEDIDDDGWSTQADKQIVLDILDKQVIKDKGGIGRYPGTMSVHFDVRGFKARWDQQ